MSFDRTYNLNIPPGTPNQSVVSTSLHLSSETGPLIVDVSAYGVAAILFAGLPTAAQCVAMLSGNAADLWPDVIAMTSGSPVRAQLPDDATDITAFFWTGPGAGGSAGVTVRVHANTGS